MNDYQLIKPQDLSAVKCDDKPPATKRCPHCGKALSPIGIFHQNRTYWVSFEQCRCQAAEVVDDKTDQELAYRKAGIPKRFIGAALTDSGLAGYLRKFDGKVSGLFVSSTAHTARAQELCAMAKMFVDSEYRAKYVKSIDLLSEIQGTFAASATEEYIARYRCCDVLIIDSFGLEAPRHWQLSTLLRIIDYRHDALLPTIIGSHLDRAKLESSLARGNEKDLAHALTDVICSSFEFISLDPDRWI